MVSPRRWLPLGGVSVALALAASVAFAGAVFRVAQIGREFSVATLAIAAGDTVQFSNEDTFLHQIYAYSAAFSFDSDEQAPGETLAVRFPVAGTFEVHCHIHPKMRLVVTVR